LFFGRCVVTSSRGDLRKKNSFLGDSFKMTDIIAESGANPTSIYIHLYT
jgi:hypothetical protein